MDKLDLVLLMSVNPGYGGQSFIPETLAKIAAVRERINASGRPVRLEVDGGVNLDTIYDVAAAGADMFVAGSAIFGVENGDYPRVIDAMRAEIARTGNPEGPPPA